MPEINIIGRVGKQEQYLHVWIGKEYRKAMKHMGKFSHIHLITVTKGCNLSVITGRIVTINDSEGEICLEVKEKEQRVHTADFPLDLIDIKPYMPSEDNAPTDARGGENAGITVQEREDAAAYEIKYMGEIRNTHGAAYLQYRDEFSLPGKLSEFIHVIWWFDKFEDSRYRRILQCDPPYKCEGKTGVFACRAPVRPNPIAVTDVRVEGIDYENHRIYISRIESFDHTPFLGVIDYDARLDKIDREELKLPEWTADWPDEIKIDETKRNEDIEAVIEALDSNKQILGRLEHKQVEKPSENYNPDCITVKGARENNLKGISLSIPYRQITAVVGVSGSGKSSLVMDTVYAECRRRMEYLSAEGTARPRPEMESMNGCIPAVMLSQKEIRANSNSTIGSFCGVWHHLRCIYAAVGKRNLIDKNRVEFKLTPAAFSFMDPECRCQACDGKGRKNIPDIAKIITMPGKSLLEGAIPFLGKLRNFIDSPNANWMKGQVVALAQDMEIDLSRPWKELPKEFRDKVLYGDKAKKITFSFDNKKNGRKGDITRSVEGIIPFINRTYIEGDKGGMGKKYMSELSCEVCNGERLAAEGRLVTVLGIRFPVAAGLSFFEMRRFAAKMKQELPQEELQLTEEHIDAIAASCDTAQRLGIEYLELGREPSMLSGGEAQRLKLLSAFQNHMTGILYIFDEPSRKLSQREYGYIMDMMRELVDEGNTILMVEHNMDMIGIADYVIEIGPKAGARGGYLMAEGRLEDVMAHKNSMLGSYAVSDNSFHKGRRGHFVPGQEFKVMHVTANNLHDVSVAIPKQALTCITGVSGSGKSTLLYKGIMPQTEKSGGFHQVILVESHISGGSSRSVVATYVGIMDEIRSIFASCEEAVKAGLADKDFSFNTGKLRCEHCGGDGRVKIPYSADAYGVCPVCRGRRYAKTADHILWRGKSIADVLGLSAEEAAEFFKEKEEIAEKCELLSRVGLSYLKLGHSTGALSGGEAARLKIASCLMNANMKNTLLLLDEPTCGLHFSDVDNLISLLYDMIDSGNTVVCIEHNKRFLEAADYTIAMGPGAGAEGGKIISAK